MLVFINVIMVEKDAILLVLSLICIDVQEEII